MNQDERQKLDEIHEDVRETRTQTRVIEQKISSMEDDVVGNRDDIDELQGKVRRNSTIIGGIGTGLSALILWAADKLSRII